MLVCMCSGSTDKKTFLLCTSPCISSLVRNVIQHDQNTTRWILEPIVQQQPYRMRSSMLNHVTPQRAKICTKSSDVTQATVIFVTTRPTSRCSIDGRTSLYSNILLFTFVAKRTGTGWMTPHLSC